ncbi:AAEL010097-PA [Aedes aegypti]|uniref:AAEL010097-PA n=2 Tax=Aedes aegypti TaxID=7159 RepID=A0A1S4FP85_AEDAE|nr:maternal protein exuperantia-2 [Aedes aegypti]EAT37963.1 AAEL010097-PA [Aedes aegypti]
MVTGGIDESKTEGEFDQQQLDESCSDESDTGPAGALSSKFDRTDVSINTNPLPYGKYTLIGIDIDTTGRRLIDEIVQISAYTPEHQYSQYIMPLMNLNPAARQRHQVRVITVGFFRMLKSMQTYRVVKTKTEISALNEFINWLEERYREDEGSEGIVLIYHEQRKFVPYMLIEAVKKYNLLDRFKSIVKSFANGFKLAEEKCSKTIKYFSIRQLAKLVLDESEAKDGFEGNAAYRARLAYQLARRLSKEDDEKPPTNDSTQVAAECEETQSDDEAETEEGAVGGSNTAEDEAKSQESGAATVNAENNGGPQGQNDSDDDRHQTDVDAVTGQVTTIPEPQPRSRPTTEAEREKMCSVLCDLASPITSEISELDEQEKILIRQNSLRPVFLQYFKTTIYHRVKAVTYRRVLAEYGHDFASLQQVWNDSKREGLEAVVNKITELKEEERTELVELLDCHYDPEKQQLKPVVKRVRGRSSRGRLFFGNKSNNVSGNGNGNGGNYNAANNGNVGNGNAKDQRKAVHGGRNNYHNNSNADMNNNQGGGKNNYNNNSGNNQPPSPNGGANGKKFRPRQMRRRRNQAGGRQNAMNQQQQPQMIHANA